MILLEVPDQRVKERMLSRRLCSQCGVDYNLISSRPAVPDVCDVCGGRLVARADDTPQAVQARLRDHHEKTRPVLELFRAKEVIMAVEAAGHDVSEGLIDRHQRAPLVSDVQLSKHGHDAAENASGPQTRVST